MNKTFKILLSFLLLTLTCNVNASSQKLTIGLDWFINPDHVIRVNFSARRMSRTPGNLLLLQI